MPTLYPPSSLETSITQLVLNSRSEDKQFLILMDLKRKPNMSKAEYPSS